ncbi:hypothetical protein MKX01_014733 [Papaver californicum]|nr:hypothetical protein MKX01_014733 [Papaver californicum]
MISNNDRSSSAILQVAAHNNDLGSSTTLHVGETFLNDLGRSTVLQVDRTDTNNLDSSTVPQVDTTAPSDLDRACRGREPPYGKLERVLDKVSRKYNECYPGLPHYLLNSR